MLAGVLHFIHEDIPEGACVYEIDFYPSQVFKDSYDSKEPAIYTSVIACVFFLMLLIVVTYDCVVQRRNNKIMNAAVRSNNILASLFPQNVRDRLFASENKQQKNGGDKQGLVGSENGTAPNDSGRPIADFFSETTIMFADIVGFTAWSSAREPAQVFEVRAGIQVFGFCCCKIYVPFATNVSLFAGNFVSRF